jgi:hypothetical protein
MQKKKKEEIFMDFFFSTEHSKNGRGRGGGNTKLKHEKVKCRERALFQI